ncbi:MAG: MiaB/RimO family radical SAM methylthiotransferase [Endomicrobium sp.]|nr:MiaB/RimO family radical SAM methylthiotransferase [Endomicrobium sp.]
MKKYYIYTFGCKVNQYETRLISEKFKKDNFEPAQNPEEADIVIFNSCTVTAEADKECEYYLRKTLKLGSRPEIILTGCMAKNKTPRLRDSFPEVKIVENKDELYAAPEKQSVKTFEGRSRAFLKIQDGCDSFCSYCIVPFVRNRLWSKPESEVLSEIENFVKSGYPEIVLTGIHVGKYGGGITKLIKKIIEIPLEFRVRVSSIELNEIDGGLISLMKDNPEKICRHLHIPLQSGSDEILAKMNRRYTTGDFARKTDKILTELPDSAVTTDIITGFPGETEKHHGETCDFVKRTSFSRFHIFRYSDRSGTKASQFPDKVKTEEIKKRSDDLFRIDKTKRKTFLSRHAGTKRKAVYAGKNKALTDNYITVRIPEKQSGIFEVKITENCEV